MRLGILPVKITDFLKDKEIIWIQAVSVGEVMAIKGLITALHNNFPAYKLLISTTTPTGNKIARGIVGKEDSVIYFPWDLSVIVKKIVKRLNIRLFIIVETEIWPNLISALGKRKVPIILLNGRISSRSFSGYRMVKMLLRKVLSRIKLFCMQTETDALRIKSLGAPGERVVISGNMKFDILAQERGIHSAALEVFLDSHAEDPLFVAGSTHRGEEEIILSAFNEIRNQFSRLRLLIAPRHIERTGEIEKIIAKYGLLSIRVSQISPLLLSSSMKEVEEKILILDTIGELNSIYARARIVFVGGSLVKKGGHNILEPAVWGKVILFGPYMSNFRNIIKPFLDNNAAFEVKDKNQLEQALRTFLNGSPQRREEIGTRAKRIVHEQKGATQRNIQLIREILKETLLKDKVVSQQPRK